MKSIRLLLCLTSGYCSHRLFLASHRMQQSAAHKWQRKAMHAAFARAYQHGASLRADLDTTSLEDHGSASGLTDGVSVAQSQAPPRLPMAITLAAGKVDWGVINATPFTGKARTFSLDDWLISIPNLLS